MLRFGVLGAGRIGKVHARTIAASGKAKVAYIADMAKMHSEKPEFYRFGGANEGGADDAENWSNFVGRVAAQTPGLSYKTASLGTVWQDPAHAAISAIDRHMAGSFRGAMFDKTSDVNKFNRRVIQKFNKGKARGQGARSFDEMLEMPGGRGVLVDELFVELNRRGKMKLRSAKTGEMNPKAPEWARNADWIREPDKVDKMSEAYVRALRENDRLAQENNQGLFANQWMIWDRLRQRLEPHEIMHPSIRHLPRMSLDQIKAADKVHSKAGYKAESGIARPSSPSGLAYFSLGAPVAGASALAAAAAQDDGQGGYQ